MPSRILVTGATGVVAIRAIPRIVRAGHSVTAVARSPEKAARLEALGARAIPLELFDRDAVARAVEGHDVVINLATHIPPTLFKTALPWEWRENDRIRREGSAILTDAAIAGGVKRFIQESFAPISEDGGDRWIDETWPARPTSYNRTVLDAERSAERFSAAGGDGVVLRFAGFYGPDSFLREMLAIARKGWSPLPGPAGAYWSSLSHEDAATTVTAALDVRPGTYNACDDEPLTRREFADALGEAAGAGRLRLLPGWLSAIGGKTMELLSRSQRMTNAKLKAASDWTPRWRSAREGLPAAARELEAS
jgi:nucleoside-diphosphate-sugar epimerase